MKGQAVKAGVLIVAVVALAMGGMALAQTDDRGPAGSDVPPAAYERLVDLLAPLVDDGTITDEQAAAVAERLADHLPNPRARDGDRRRPGKRLEAVRDALGVTPAELRAAAEAGQSLADVAAARGIGEDELVGLLRAPLEDRLADAVAEGDLDAARAEARLTQAESRIRDRVATPLRDRRSGGEG